MCWAWSKKEGGRREEVRAPTWELKQTEEGYDAWSLIIVTVRHCIQPQSQGDLAEKGIKH